MEDFYKNIFYPESVAVVGASSKQSNLGRNIIHNIVAWEYKGEVFPVNPRGEDVLGYKGYRSLAAIPAKVQLVVAFVPAKVIPDVVDQCVELGIKCLAVPAAGFSEFGDEGKALEKRVVEKARSGGLRILGPNCLTVINAENGLCLPFLEIGKRDPGGISIITQSGGVGLSITMILSNACRSFNKFVSIGNKLDTDEVDFLELLGKDPGTEVICMFLEDIVRGREFAEVASKINKPIIVCKASTTETGSRAAASHTASLANNDDVIDGILKQSGVIRVNSVRELAWAAIAMELPPLKSNRLVIMSQAGGYSVFITDEVVKGGFELAELDPRITDGLKERSRADIIDFKNPVDLGDVHTSDAISYAMDSTLAQADVDGLMAVLFRRSDVKYEGAFSGLSREVYGDIGKMIKKYNKPVALTVMTHSEYLKKIRSEADYPIFESPDDALLAMRVLREHGQNQGRI